MEGLPEDQYVLRGSEIRSLWADGAGQFFDKDKAAFELKVKALQPVHLSQALFVNPENLRPEAYTAGVGNATNRHPLLLHFGADSDASATFFPPRPNPFEAETSFEILTDQAASAQLEVFDLNGRRLVSELYDLEPGFQSLRLRASALPGKGVFAYRLRVGEAVSSGRLVRI